MRFKKEPALAGFFVLADFFYGQVLNGRDGVGPAARVGGICCELASSSSAQENDRTPH